MRFKSAKSDEKHIEQNVASNKSSINMIFIIAISY